MVTRGLTHLHPHADMCHVSFWVVFGLVGGPAVEQTPARGDHWLRLALLKQLPGPARRMNGWPWRSRQGDGAGLSAGRRFGEQTQLAAHGGHIKRLEAAEQARKNAQHDEDNTSWLAPKRAWEGSES